MNYLSYYRERVEKAWCEETASPNLRPTAGKPIATGQCSATSLVLFDDLHKEFGQDLLLKIAVGRVIDLEQQTDAIELHVWLQLYEDPYAIPYIIDITADQSEVINQKVIFQKNTELVSKEKLLYLPFNLFQTPSDLKPQTQSRARLLRQRLSVLAKPTLTNDH